jgi:hypothetical protein
MPLPIDISPVPASPAHLPGSTAPLPEVEASDPALSGQEINDRRAQLENPEALRLARAL